MPTVQQLAQTYAACFVTDKRDDGTAFVKTRDGSPEELQALCMHAHGDMFPDDHRYAFIEEVLIALSETEDPDEIQLEADIYTHELTGWLNSRADRCGYCDEAVEEYGSRPATTFELLQWGQAFEKAEVLGLVREWLEERAGSEAQ